MLHPFKDLDDLYETGLHLAQMPDAKRRRARFYHLMQLFALTGGLDGETIEAGCFRGLSSFLLCHMTRRLDPAFRGQTHTVVDSFEGLSAPVAADKTGREAEGRFSNTSPEHVRRTLAEFPDVMLHKGWIPEVLQGLPEKRYRFAHVDVDLYTPTLHCLAYFYDRLTPGGMIVVDDFGPWPDGGRYPGCTTAVMEFCAERGLHFAALNTGNAVIIRHDGL
ncbi:MAG: TylF/MycF family methyltransferase [Oceanicaulis sp.]|nr:TylF/MycF family methyltransferase [Oceanicaulis sp.]